MAESVTKKEKKDIEKLCEIFKALPTNNKEKLLYVGEGILLASATYAK